MLRSATFEPTNEVPAASAFLSGLYRSYYSWVPSRAEGSHSIQTVLMMPDWLDTTFHQKACVLSRQHTGTQSSASHWLQCGSPQPSCDFFHSSTFPKTKLEQPYQRLFGYAVSRLQIPTFCHSVKFWSPCISFLNKKKLRKYLWFVLILEIYLMSG